MSIPVIVLCTYPPLMKATFGALARSAQVDIHAVADIHIGSRHGSELLSSVTVLPPAPRNDEQVVSILMALAKKTGSEALLPVWSPDVAFVSRNAAALARVNPVPVPHQTLLPELKNKLRFSRLARSLGFTTPRTIEIGPELDADETIRLLGLPMLAKPTLGAGGRGIVDILDAADLEALSRNTSRTPKMFLQEKVSGEDVALTLLADRGEVFAVMLRKRWFSSRRSSAYAPMINIEFFRDGWLEDLGRDLVRLTQFSGIADFDLKVDFASRSAYFLEADPRMMGGLEATEHLGFNTPWLLVERVRGNLPDGTCVRPEDGYFMPLCSVPEWILRGVWRRPRRRPLHTNWRSVARDPRAALRRFLSDL